MKFNKIYIGERILQKGIPQDGNDEATTEIHKKQARFMWGKEKSIIFAPKFELLWQTILNLY